MPVAPLASKHERGGLSEIGGQMSVADGKPVEKKARGTKRKKVEPAFESRAASSAEPVTAEPKAGAEDESYGIDTIRRSASQSLHTEGGSIVDTMTNKAKQGDVSSAKFLCVLGDERKELTEAQVRRVERSLATNWTGEPKWVKVIEESQHDDWSRLRTP